MVKQTSHEGRCNGIATWSLRMLSDVDPQEALIKLFASDEPIDPETRTAILEALIAGRDEKRGVMKLGVVPPAHRLRTQDSELTILERRHRIGAEALALIASGSDTKNVVDDLALKHDVSITEVRNSIKDRKKHSFTVSRGKQK